MTQVHRRLSINQATVPRWSVPELMDGVARAGYRAVGLWRDRVAVTGEDKAARLARDASVQISSLCRGGWFCAPDATARAERAADNRKAVDEAAVLGAAALVIVAGPAMGKDLDKGRAEVAEALAEMAEYAARAGVVLALEPMHPVYCGDRSVIVTLAQAVNEALRAGPGVKVMLDSYHLWWDPGLEASLAGAAGLVGGLQLADWLAPPPDPLNGRGMLGEGSIDLRHFCQMVERHTGYSGPVEVEVFNPQVWAQPPGQVLAQVADAYSRYVEPGPA